MEVQYSKESISSPDGTPPSFASLSENHREKYGTSARANARRAWLGSEVLPEMEKGIPLPQKRNGLMNGYASHSANAVEQPDLLRVMEASWCASPIPPQPVSPVLIIAASVQSDGRRPMKSLR